MLKHIKFIILGSMLTSPFCYIGFFSLVNDQKIFISSPIVAFFSTFLFFILNLIFYWSMACCLMHLLLKKYSDLTKIKAYYTSSLSLFMLAASIISIFKLTIFDIPINSGILLLIFVPYFISLALAPKLIKYSYK